MRLVFPPSLSDVPGAPTAVTEAGRRVLVQARAHGTRVTVRLDNVALLTSSAIGALHAPARVLSGPAATAAASQTAQVPSPPSAVLQSGVLTVYVDGSGTGGGGWGVVAVTDGRGGADADARLRDERYGPLVLDRDAPPYLGAERTTNQTAELTAFAEGLEYLRVEDGTTAPAVVRPDSTYARDIALGLSRPTANAALAQRVRALWMAEHERRGGQLWAVHVRGHTGHKWNSRADRAAARGALGFVRGIGERWVSWPPLEKRVLRAHEVDEAQRIGRARHVFGALASPVPVHGVTLSVPQLTALLAGVERRMQGLPEPRAGVALRRARAAHRLLSDPQRQREAVRKIIADGLQPVTSELTCPVNRQAVERYVAHAGAEADVMLFDKRGRPRGTCRELARGFLVRLAGRDEVRVKYRHSLLGAELVAAGFVVASREYGFGDAADPFRLPRDLRDIAFARRGHDMDDSASYPRACLDVFRAGRAESTLFLAAGDREPNREVILRDLGRHFFGDGTPAKQRRKWVKELMNALDNDGTIGGWRARCVQAGHPTRAGASSDHARADLGGGVTFSLRAYAESRQDMTHEFEERMPGMHAFVRAWLRARRDARLASSGLTAKSYFLQEAEGLSRRAKVTYAARRGDLAVTSLQHDGVVIMPPASVDVEAVRADLTAACSEILGYAQPVEERSRLARTSRTQSTRMTDGSVAALAVALAL